MSKLKSSAIAKLVKQLEGEQKALAETGNVFSARFLGVVSLPTTVIGAHGFVQDALTRLLKENLYVPKDVYVAMDKTDLEIWEADSLAPMMQIAVNMVEWTGEMEGRYAKNFGIVFRHRTGSLLCPSFAVKESPDAIPQEIGRVFKEANKYSENPYRPLPGSCKFAASGKKEVLEGTPWFVGKTPRKAVEDALTVGLVGDYVVRESESTPGAYVLVIKLKPSEFIEHKIIKQKNGNYKIQGKDTEYPTIELIIRSDINATRAAKGVVLGDLIQNDGAKGGGVSRARRASVSGVRDQGKIDIETDVKAYDTTYLGFQDIFGKVDGVEQYKAKIKGCVVKNSESRAELRRLAKESKAKYLAAKSLKEFQNVQEDLPVTVVITPILIRIVERLSGESLVKVFISNVPFTLEAPSRDKELDKFIFVQTNARGSIACHIFNVSHGLGHVLAEAISYYIEQAADIYSPKQIAKSNPFAAAGKRLAAPKSLFARQIHRVDMSAIKPIGAGQFGEVWLANQAVKRSGQVVQVTRAVKMLKASAIASARQEFVREAETMLKFDHDNVTRIVGVCVQQPPWLSVLEFMQYGAIREFLISAEQKAVSITPGERLDMCYQLCKGCGYVISLGLVHMDIAARNVLMGANNLVKLADFGLTRPMDPGTTHYRLKEKLAISIKWAALEALERKCFDEKTDVWSYGITAWEIFSNGAVPLREVPLAQTVKQLRAGVRPGQPDLCPPDIWTLLVKTWDSNAKERPTFKEIEQRCLQLSKKYKIEEPRRDVGVAVDTATMPATAAASS